MAIRIGSGAWFLPTEAKFLERLSGLQRQQALSRIARASANPAVAFELRWADVTRANRGMRRFADEAAEEIEFKADLRTTIGSGRATMDPGPAQSLTSGARCSLAKPAMLLQYDTRNAAERGRLTMVLAAKRVPW